MITINVQFDSALRRFAPGGSRDFQIKLEAGATLAELIKSINLPAGYPKIVFVDDQLLSLDTVLHDGAKVRVFTQLSGGSVG